MRDLFWAKGVRVPANRIPLYVNFLQKFDRILCGKPVQLFCSAHSTVYPASTDGRQIHLHEDLFRLNYREETRLGVNLHELAHCYYGNHAYDFMIWKEGLTEARNILVDCRDETLYAKMYPRAKVYFLSSVQEMIVRGRLATELGDCWTLLYGRKHLPRALRLQSAPIERMGPEWVREVARLIDEFVQLAPANWSVDRMFEITKQFNDLLQQTRFEKTPCAVGRRSKQALIGNVEIPAEILKALANIGSKDQVGLAMSSAKKASPEAKEKKVWNAITQPKRRLVAEEDMDLDGYKPDPNRPVLDPTEDPSKIPIDLKTRSDALERSLDGIKEHSPEMYQEALDQLDAVRRAQAQSETDADQEEDIDEDEVGEADESEYEEPFADDEDEEDAVTGSEAAAALREMDEDKPFGPREMEQHIEAAGVDVMEVLDHLRQQVYMTEEPPAGEDVVTPELERWCSAFTDDLKRIASCLVNRAQIGRRGALSMSRAMQSEVLPSPDIFRQVLQTPSRSRMGAEVIMLLDHSGSMQNNLNQVSQTAWAIGRAFEEVGSQVTLISFETRCKMIKEGKNKFNRHSYPMLDSGGGTMPLKALEAAYQIFEESPLLHKVLFILTDGAWTETSKCQVIIQQANEVGISTIMVYMDNGISHDRWRKDSEYRKYLIDTYRHECQDFYPLRDASGLLGLMELSFAQQFAKGVKKHLRQMV